MKTASDKKINKIVRKCLEYFVPMTPVATIHDQSGFSVTIPRTTSTESSWEARYFEVWVQGAGTHATDDTIWHYAKIPNQLFDLANNAGYPRASVEFDCYRLNLVKLDDRYSFTFYNALEGSDVVYKNLIIHAY